MSLTPAFVNHLIGINTCMSTVEIQYNVYESTPYAATVFFHRRNRIIRSAGDIVNSTIHMEVLNEQHRL